MIALIIPKGSKISKEFLVPKETKVSQELPRTDRRRQLLKNQSLFQWWAEHQADFERVKSMAETPSLNVKKDTKMPMNQARLYHFKKG